MPLLEVFEGHEARLKDHPATGHTLGNVVVSPMGCIERETRSVVVDACQQGGALPWGHYAGIRCKQGRVDLGVACCCGWSAELGLTTVILQCKLCLPGFFHASAHEFRSPLLQVSLTASAV